ncbi:MAG: LysM peptidoglycan-binding domain-containing protein, partial [Bacteroidota bacterium]
MRFRGTVMLMICGLLGLGRAEAAEWLRDSLRTEVQDGKRFVIHKVESGENFYRLTLRYGSTREAIVKANPILAQGLQANQTIRIPLEGNVASATPVTATANATVHTVAPGEGLFRIAQKYDVSQADIMKWNNLTSDQLSIGQELLIKGAARSSIASTDVPDESSNTEVNTNSGEDTHVVESSETLFRISQKYGVTVADLMIWNKLPDTNISVGQTLVLKAPAEGEENSSPAPVQSTPSGTETQVAANTSTTPNNTSEDPANIKPSPTPPVTQPDEAASMPSTGIP